MSFAIALARLSRTYALTVFSGTDKSISLCAQRAAVSTAAAGSFVCVNIAMLSLGISPFLSSCLYSAPQRGQIHFLRSVFKFNLCPHEMHLPSVVICMLLSFPWLPVTCLLSDHRPAFFVSQPLSFVVVIDLAAALKAPL